MPESKDPCSAHTTRAACSPAHPNDQSGPGTLRFLASIAFFLCLAMPALARNWRIADFHSTVAIDDRGATSVTEKITLVFVGQYNGIWRSIPVEYPSPNG
jgi:hypothetical protein